MSPPWGAALKYWILLKLESLPFVASSPWSLSHWVSCLVAIPQPHQFCTNTPSARLGCACSPIPPPTPVLWCFPLYFLHIRKFSVHTFYHLGNLSCPSVNLGPSSYILTMPLNSYLHELISKAFLVYLYVPGSRTSLISICWLIYNNEALHNVH